MKVRVSRRRATFGGISVLAAVALLVGLTGAHAAGTNNNPTQLPLVALPHRA